jgi:hypothetical protein
MRAHRHVVDRSYIERSNADAKHRLNYMRKFVEQCDTDPDRQRRRDAGVCRICWYQKSRIGGAAVTMRQCAFCHDVCHSGNTNVDVLCKACAVSYGLCSHCGADIEYVNKRSRLLPEISGSNCTKCGYGPGKCPGCESRGGT